jgi:hypothetical protein
MVDENPSIRFSKLTPDANTTLLANHSSEKNKYTLKDSMA